MIPLARPAISSEAALLISGVLDTGWVTMGPKTAEFEQMVAAKTGAAAAVAMNSATNALHLTLAACGIGAGDEVVVPAFTFAATVAAVVHAGAHPVFADIDPDTLGLTVDTIAAALTPSTKAVFLVHQFGFAADLDPIARFCRERRLTLVEDAACALGSTYRGRPIGDGAHPAIFSFHPRKIITTGEGGMVTTNDMALANRLRRLRYHGLNLGQNPNLPSGAHIEVGYNAKLTDIQAALGIEQMRRLDEFIEERNRQAAYYLDAMRGEDRLRAFTPSPGSRANYQSFPVLASDAERRDHALAALAKAGVETKRCYAALHTEPAFHAFAPPRSLAVSERMAELGFFLPVYPGLTETDQGIVLEALLGRR